MADEVRACPECDSPQVNHRKTARPTWRCWACGATFDAPVERPRKPNGGARHSSEHREAVLRALVDRYQHPTVDYVKSSHLTDATGLGVQVVGQLLDCLADEGYLDARAEDTTPRVYRMTDKLDAFEASDSAAATAEGDD